MERILVYGVFILTISFSLNFSPAHATPTCGPAESTSSASLSMGIWDKFVYYMEKIPEVFHLNYRSYQMITTGKAAQSKKFNTKMQVVKLGQMKFYHPVEGDGNHAAEEKTRKRAMVLKEKEAEILSAQPFRPEEYNKFLPSIDPIQLISFGRENGDEERGKEKFLIIQGQGRIAAMKKVFGDDFQVLVETSEVDQKTLEDLDKVRQGYIQLGFIKD